MRMSSLYLPPFLLSLSLSLSLSLFLSLSLSHTHTHTYIHTYIHMYMYPPHLSSSSFSPYILQSPFSRLPTASVMWIANVVSLPSISIRTRGRSRVVILLLRDHLVHLGRAQHQRQPKQPLA